MRTSRWWIGASLGMALLMAGYGLRAQEPIPSPQRNGALPSPDSHTTMPHESGEHGHEEHGGHEEEEGEHVSEGGLFGSADFLLVRPRRRPHDYAIVGPAGSTLVGEVKNFDWETTGGYRLSLGYKLAEGWEMAGVYTYVHSKDEQSIAAGRGQQIFPTLSAPITFDGVGGAAGSSNLDLDVIDVEFAKRWLACEDVHVRFATGLRIATIQQKQSLAYDFTRSGFGLSNVNQDIQYDGIGARIGGEAWWKVWGNIGLYGKAFGSLMSGDFNVRVNQWVNSGRLLIVDVSDHFQKVVPVTEMGLGLGWHGENLSFRVGYELQNFFGMVDQIDFNDNATFKPAWRHGDLTLEALTVSLGFAY